MKKLVLAGLLTGSLALGGCASVITQLQQGTTALINFNNALITLNLTILGNLKAQAQQLAPLVCGGISLGDTLASDPKIGGVVNAYLSAHQGQGRIVAVATDLCAVAGLPANVTALPANAAVPAASKV